MTQYPNISNGDQLNASAFTKTFQNLMAINLAHGKGVVSGLVPSPGSSPGTISVTAGEFVAQIHAFVANPFVFTVGNSVSGYLWVQANDDSLDVPACELSGTDPGAIWVCLGHVDSDGSGSVTVTSAGRQAFGSSDVARRVASTDPLPIAGGLGAVSKVIAGSSVTLSATEAAATSILLSGSPGAARNVVVPAVAGKFYLVTNGTDSTITVKTPLGTGVAIASGKSAIVNGDGTNVVRITADA